MAAIELYSTPLYSNANLVSYWRLESNGSDSKGSNTGIVSSATFGAAKFNNGAIFAKASSANIYFGNIFQLVDYANISFSFWYKSSTSSTNDSIISNYSNGGGGGFSIDLRTTGKIRFSAWNTDGAEIGGADSPVAVNDGNLHHIVCVKNGTSHTVYVDGSAGTPATFTPVTPTVAGIFRLGGEANVYGYSDCTLDDVAVFNRVLSATEVSNLYAGTWPVTYTLTCDVGNVTLTGNATNFYKYWHMGCTTASFALTGFAANLNKVKRLICETGSFVLTGFATTFTEIVKLLQDSKPTSTLTLDSRLASTLSQDNKLASVMTVDAKVATPVLSQDNKLTSGLLLSSTIYPFYLDYPLLWVGNGQIINTETK